MTRPHFNGNANNELETNADDGDDADGTDLPVRSLFEEGVGQGEEQPPAFFDNDPIQKTADDSTVPTTSSLEEAPRRSARLKQKPSSSEPKRKQKRTKEPAQHASAQLETQRDEWVINRIVDTSPDDEDKSDKPRTLFRVRWYGYDAKSDTWEPAAHLPRSTIVRFCKRKGIELPHDIDQSQIG